jgi:phosphatidate phosphatase PAH1
VITFSISSDVIACTSRIFVWDYMDHVVVSDIDGTITKYVFPRHFCLGLSSHSSHNFVGLMVSGMFLP